MELIYNAHIAVYMNCDEDELRPETVAKAQKAIKSQAVTEAIYTELFLALGEDLDGLALEVELPCSDPECVCRTGITKWHRTAKDARKLLMLTKDRHGQKNARQAHGRASRRETRRDTPAD